MIKMDGRWYQIGVTSRLQVWSKDSRSVVYTRLAAYTNWILSKIKAN
jgi:hypothetical protein